RPSPPTPTSSSGEATASDSISPRGATPASAASSPGPGRRWRESAPGATASTRTSRSGRPRRRPSWAAERSPSLRAARPTRPSCGGGARRTFAPSAPAENRMRVPLPIDPVLPRLSEALRREGAAVLHAPPGAGKTTRVPPALLEAGLADEGEILVLQPRRLPTRLGAERVAAELGERPGETVGYQMRYESSGGPRTRIRFLTEGTLTRRILADPSLAGVAVVVFDEVHERNLATDVALALAERLRRTTRPDLKLLAMSATLEAEKFADYLGVGEVITSEGRPFHVEVQHLERPDDRPLHLQ